MVRCACGTVVLGPVPGLVWSGCYLVPSLSFAAASVLAFGQWVLIVGCGWWDARGRLRAVHGDSEFYRRPLS